MNLKEMMEHKGAHAYVDGSFNSKTFEYGSGIVFIIDGEVVWEKSLKGNDPILAKQRNVAGEMRAAIAATIFAHRLHLTEFYLHYDYVGIEQWATGGWKRNNDFTKKYHEFMNEMKDKIEINFRKVKAHSNVTYNDKADELAKKACGLL